MFGQVYVSRFSILLGLIFFLSAVNPIDGQAQRSHKKSPAKAALLSFAMPGLGHRYVNESTWSRKASRYALADVSTWLAIAGSSWRRNDAIDGYRILATTGASADVGDKNRRFFLNLATYKSSDAYLESALRNRAWDQLDYVNDVSFQWEWISDDDFADYRRLRERAESLDRRRSILVAVLITNRALSGITSMLQARQANLSAVSLSATTLEGNPALTLNAHF